MSAGVVARRDGPVVRITLARPDVRNAIDAAGAQAVVATLEDAALDDQTRVVLICAEGEHFCAGWDLASSNAPNENKPRPGHIQRRLAHGAHRVIRTLWELQLPVVAGVRGHAVGFGAHLAYACDYVIAGESARFSEPFVTRGFTPDSAGSFLLPRLVGLRRAKQMLMLGRPVTAHEALDWGLVSAVVPDSELDLHIERISADFARSATVAVGLAKWLVHRAVELDMQHALDAEAFTEELAVRTADFKEGMAAFRDRRTPNYEGR